MAYAYSEIHVSIEPKNNFRKIMDSDGRSKLPEHLVTRRSASLRQSLAHQHLFPTGC